MPRSFIGTLMKRRVTQRRMAKRPFGAASILFILPILAGMTGVTSADIRPEADQTSESAPNGPAGEGTQGASDGKYYLFSYFTGNGEDGMHFAASRDALRWTPCKDGKPFLSPIDSPRSDLIRDPSICRGPDGRWHCVWTVSWDGKHIGYASSSDLIEWSEPKRIPTLIDEPTARNSWAPEIFYDDATGQYYIIWSTTIPGRFGQEECGDDHYDHRAYVITTKDFERFSSPRLFFDPGHSVIDGFLFKRDGTYYLFYKDERLKPEKKIINIASSRSADGPFTPQKTVSAHSWVEGPSAVAVGDEVFLFYDCYIADRYGGVKSKDLQNWEDIEGEIEFPEGARHGTVFEVDRETYRRVESAR